VYCGNKILSPPRLARGLRIHSYPGMLQVVAGGVNCIAPYLMKGGSTNNMQMAFFEDYLLHGMFEKEYSLLRNPFPSAQTKTTKQAED